MTLEIVHELCLTALISQQWKSIKFDVIDENIIENVFYIISLIRVARLNIEPTVHYCCFSFPMEIGYTFEAATA